MMPCYRCKASSQCKRDLHIPCTQTALDRGDINVAVNTVLSLARRGYTGAGRAAAVLAAGGHLEGQAPGLAAELLASALTRCPAGELPSLLDRWIAADRSGAATASASAEDCVNESRDSMSNVGGFRAAAASRPSAGWLTHRLGECFARAGAGAARGLGLLPQLADSHLAIAALAALGFQPAMAALESCLGDGLGPAMPRAALLLGMFATGTRALESSHDMPTGDGTEAVDAVATRARQRLMLSPWAVLQHVRQLPAQLPDDLDAARTACLEYERYLLNFPHLYSAGSVILH